MSLTATLVRVGLANDIKDVNFFLTLYDDPASLCNALTGETMGQLSDLCSMYKIGPTPLSSATAGDYTTTCGSNLNIFNHACPVTATCSVTL